MNLPNKISITRICLIPVFVAAFFLEGILPYNYLIASGIFALAACTDFIDGYIARKHNLVTNLGKFLDPIADKVLVSTAMFLLLTFQYSVNTFGRLTYERFKFVHMVLTVCICVIMARELIISAFRQIAATRGVVMAADKLGKYKTTFQDISIVVLLVSADLTGTAQKVCVIAGLALFGIATILTIWSGISYVVKNKQVLKDA